MPSTAAVIDLASFRAARRSRAADPGKRTMPAPTAFAPFWIVWVPAWPVR